ncbi:Sec-independent protein translocase subunit TatA [Actinomadura barringtoniae]|uniref:Sec-independent protein translocase protein TatA n=1 Tax=Actinomadura barringtoniae TaxID=1427535 RepID=A0A939PJA9_9ACTN|nr:Sec-independent protein translocase subunit TatA [Actinomadura barringtoniae]MBO2453425.1 Sec-independent protein translocase subunit TatA [Actinomadura barringtoniae]
MVGEFSPTHWLIVILVFVLLFGSKKLPEMARSLGRSARILKSEVNGLHDKDEDETKGEGGQPPALSMAVPASDDRDRDREQPSDITR